MKNFLIGLLLSFALFTAQPSHAVVSSAATYRVLFSTSNVDTVLYSTLVASTAKAVKGISVYNTSPNPIQIAFGASSSEVVQLTVPPGTLPGGAYNGSPVGTYNPAANFYAIPISQGQRVSYKALNSTITQGEIQVNLLYY